MANATAGAQRKTFAGHPPALFALFFAEMWERFSYYGMRALLVLYMMKGFLNYGDDGAYKVYGAYTALVYMTPFIGGMIADRLLGARRSVVLGGLLMAAGHLLMTVESSVPFFLALSLLIVGNGFFKPNISTIVASLYDKDDDRQDAGFSIFYMGINLGAGMSPLLCGYVGETYGWHYGFGLATLGMLIGLAVFVAPTKLTQWLIGGGAVTTAIAMVSIQNNTYLLIVSTVVGLALAVAGVSAFIALGREGLPPEAGGAPDPALLASPWFGVPRGREIAVYVGTTLVVPVIAMLVWSNRTIRLISEETLDGLTSSSAGAVHLLGVLLGEISRPAGLVLLVIGVLAFGYIAYEAVRSPRRERDRLFVVLSLMFFSMLFWAFFEQAGSSISNFTDRNVDRVVEAQVVTTADIGSDLSFTLSQEQLGFPHAGSVFTLDELDAARKAVSEGDADAAEVTWRMTPAHVGMGLGGSEVPTSTFQSANPIYILLFAMVFANLWTFLGSRKVRMGGPLRFFFLKGLEPSAPLKFALGLVQLGLGFGVLWYGASVADDRGMVAMSWLLIAYLLHTTGELCLSPVGLSMVTKLSPAKLISTVMGGWFLATGFSSYLGAIIATLTGVEGGGGEHGGVPAPIETVHVYGDVFGVIAMAALAAAVLLFLMSPFLTAAMHEGDADHHDESEAA